MWTKLIKWTALPLIVVGATLAAHPREAQAQAVTYYYGSPTSYVSAYGATPYYSYYSPTSRYYYNYNYRPYTSINPYTSIAPYTYRYSPTAPYISYRYNYTPRTFSYGYTLPSPYPYRASRYSYYYGPWGTRGW